MDKAFSALERQGFDVRRAATAKDAADMVRALIPADASVGVGGSVTIDQLGIIPELQAAGHAVHWHWLSWEPLADAYLGAARADVYLCSANALTTQGQIINTDRTGNRISATLYGPGHAVMVIGSNKVVEGGFAQGLARIKTVACPQNARRLKLDTPCAQTGRCHADACAHSMCGVTAMLERPVTGHKMTVILVDEPLGY